MKFLKLFFRKKVLNNENTIIVYNEDGKFALTQKVIK